MKISIVTLGCRVNQAESLEFERELLQSGHEIVSGEEIADLGIINTCAVTARADQQSRQEIRRMMTKTNKLIVTGCFAELNHEVVNLLDPGISIFTNEMKHLITKSVLGASNSPQNPTFEISRSRPAVKIQDGCNFKCAYCVIPTSRGRSRSVQAAQIIEKIRWYHEQGKNEVVLSGIHLGSYGRDLTPPSDLASLLQEVLSWTDIRRIRLSSIEITEVTDHLLEIMKSPRVCSHLHIPLQSGDNSILKRMNRHYKAEYYYSKLQALTDLFPMMSIGTDVMVGFPGEGELEFENTYSLIESLPFSYIHVFPYSPRPGTASFVFRPLVSEYEKGLRVSRLRQLGEFKRASYIVRNLNCSQSVILEDLRDDVFQGTSANYLKVSVKATSGLKKGMLVEARLTGYDGGGLWAIPMSAREPSHN